MCTLLIGQTYISDQSEPCSSDLKTTWRQHHYSTANVHWSSAPESILPIQQTITYAETWVKTWDDRNEYFKTTSLLKVHKIHYVKFMYTPRKRLYQEL